LFRSIARIGVATYNQEESAAAVQVDHEYIRPDWQKIGKCYDTAAGVGIGGRKADKGERAKGMPLFVLFVLIGLAGLAFHYLTSPKLWAHVIPGGTPIKVAAKISTNAPPPIAGTNTVQIVAHDGTNAPVAIVAPPRPILTGIAQVPGGYVMAYFKDGQVIDSLNRRFGGLVRVPGGKVVGAIIDGERFYVGSL